jgi:ABC-type transport system substrate-binding protein
MKKSSYSIVFLALLLLAAGLAGCKSNSVVSDSSAPAKSAALQTSTSSASATNAIGSATPVAATNTAPAAQNQQPVTSPTLLPIMKQAQAKPGVPVSVPESMKRPLNPEEMKKALEQMPPEVRARIQGMQAAPQGVKPQATPKK